MAKWIDLNVLKLTYIFLTFKKESIGSVQFNEKIINMNILTKVCISFHTQVFKHFIRMWFFTTKFF